MSKRINSTKKEQLIIIGDLVTFTLDHVNLLDDKYNVTFIGHSYNEYSSIATVINIFNYGCGGLDGDSVGDSLENDKFLKLIDNIINKEKKINLIVDGNNGDNIERIGLYINKLCSKKNIKCNNYLIEPFACFGSKMRKDFDIYYDNVSDKVKFMYKSHDIIKKVSKKILITDAMKIIELIIFKKMINPRLSIDKLENYAIKECKEEEYQKIKEETIKKRQKIEKKYTSKNFRILNEGEYVVETRKLNKEFLEKCKELDKKYSIDKQIINY